ncbi:hypothetical protein FRB94_010181 [Tulasnella sp. JGI-2019a]|nr:hypothetical protein FRB93_012761 [Tulasnella sp. JGI-2019a]KAG8994064.1 hypothetical protein FRB94_010181 [Tulasnella sp. JGI-2019a]KAG9023700.1 hypothetical protein FRB95_012619 [Tulasnella sp. JGI-2019a]
MSNKALISHCHKLVMELGWAKALSNVSTSCTEASNMQLMLAHMEIKKLQTTLHEVKKEGKVKNSQVKLMSSSSTHLLTSDEFWDAVQADKEVAKMKAAKKVVTASTHVLNKEKKEWRVKDITARKAACDKQCAVWVKVCQRAEDKGVSKPKLGLAPKQPKTPLNSFFQSADAGCISEEEEKSDEESDEEESGKE